MKKADINSVYSVFQHSQGVFTDTRNPLAGGLFFALGGPNFDGNEFAHQALAKGARAAVIDNANSWKDDRYLLVDNVLDCLQQVANLHRSQFTIPVIAITGSNGKTTTKELMQRVLARKYEVVATKGNLNNHIGVPLTLLDIEEGTELAIIEMGANHQGEIAALCEIATPDPWIDYQHRPRSY